MTEQGPQLDQSGQIRLPLVLMSEIEKLYNINMNKYLATLESEGMSQSHRLIFGNVVCNTGE